MSTGFGRWRRLHLASSTVVGLIGLIHSALTPLFYRHWTPNAVWFLGTGLGVLLLALVNLTHVGTEPCRYASASVIRWSNLVFVMLGLGAIVAVPEPQAYVLVAALAGQAIAGLRTLRA